MLLLLAGGGVVGGGGGVVGGGGVNGVCCGWGVITIWELNAPSLFSVSLKFSAKA